MPIDARAVLRSLTLEQKAEFLDGRDFWHTEELPTHGVPAITLTDGTYGLRKQIPATGPLSLSESIPATCFPPAAGLASSWDPQLVEAVGEALGDECRAADVAVLLGPAMNIKRSPLCGRNFEYFSEDPLLTARLAAAMVRGLQGRGVGSALKHFAANNQETERMSVSVQVDERTLREIYLRAFEFVVQEARPWAVMAAYNRINGVYAAESRWLLTDVLRDEWGFDGVVISDWGAVNRRADALRAGLDLEMPSSAGASAKTILSALRDGDLCEEDVDRAVTRVLSLVSRAQPCRPPGGFDADAHHLLALRAAHASAVLLKNDGDLLPLAPDYGPPIAVIGEFARAPVFQGSGSSLVNPTRVDTALGGIEAIVAGRRELLFAPGFALDAAGMTEPGLLASAVAAAAAADVAVVFLGLTPGTESEAWDRADIDLPAEQLELLDAVVGANPRVVVVLSGGGVVAVSGWEQRVPAILQCWLLGQAGGAAIADLLMGVVSPSGRLAETIPERLEHTPAFGNFPGENGCVHYGERTLVGYRWYDTRRLPVSYPFGHGLTYSTFAYEQLRVSVVDDGPRPKVVVSLKLTNTGARSAVETPQVYVSDVAASVLRPAQELRAFARVGLNPGQSTTVSWQLEHDAFALWHPSLGRWLVEAGDFEVRVGASSRDIRLCARVELAGEPVAATLALHSSTGQFLDDPWVGRAVRELLDPGTLRLLTEGSMVGELVRQVPLVRLGRYFPRSSVDEHQVAELLTVRAAMSRDG